MKLVKLECPNCKAKLEVNEEMEKFTCNYCGTTILLDDEHIHVDVKNNTMETEIQELKDIYENGNKLLAYNKASELHYKYPKNNEINVIYEKLSNEVTSEDYNDAINDAMDRAKGMLSSNPLTKGIAPTFSLSFILIGIVTIIIFIMVIITMIRIFSAF